MVKRGCAKHVGCTECAPLIETLTRTNEELLAEIKRINAEKEELRKLALTDTLTELPSRRAFNEQLTHAIAVANRKKRTLSIVLCDIDDFKLINTKYSHAGGDTVLKKIADLLQHNCRAEDMVARVGGEEFAFILEETPCKHAIGLIERVRSTIAEYHFQLVSDTYFETPITMSFGIAKYRAGDTLESLYRRATEALKEAKETGKNRISVAEND